jgi:hypothetical protein
MAQFSPEKFLDFVRNYREDNPKHKAAMLEFAQKVQVLDANLLSDEANWVRVYRTTPTAGPILNVPYYSQRDNYRDVSRTCFSSSCAMLLEFMKPGTLPGSKGDDKYIQRVFSIGDTTDSYVQTQALASFDLKASFTSGGTFSLLDSQLSKGVPVPVGILHHGTQNHPTGGGHWIIVIGKQVDDKAPGGVWYIVNDPWGEINNSDGTYTNTNGNRVKYSKNLLKGRWTVEGDGSGYAIIA